MYELKDSYFFMFDTSSLLLTAGVAIALALAGFFFFKSKKRKYHN